MARFSDSSKTRKCLRIGLWLAPNCGQAQLSLVGESIWNCGQADYARSPFLIFNHPVSAGSTSNLTPMKYSLRSLMIVVALGPPLLAAGIFLWQERQTQKLAFMACGGITFSLWLWFEFRPTITVTSSRSRTKTCKMPQGASYLAAFESPVPAADDRPTAPQPRFIGTENLDWLTDQMRQEEQAGLESQTMEAAND